MTPTILNRMQQQLESLTQRVEALESNMSTRNKQELIRGLRGPPGPVGPPGKDGKDGEDGKDGQDATSSEEIAKMSATLETLKQQVSKSTASEELILQTPEMNSIVMEPVEVPPAMLDVVTNQNEAGDMLLEELGRLENLSGTSDTIFESKESDHEPVIEIDDQELEKALPFDGNAKTDNKSEKTLRSEDSFVEPTSEKEKIATSLDSVPQNPSSDHDTSTKPASAGTTSTPTFEEPETSSEPVAFPQQSSSSEEPVESSVPSQQSSPSDESIESSEPVSSASDEPVESSEPLQQSSTPSDEPVESSEPVASTQESSSPSDEPVESSEPISSTQQSSQSSSPSDEPVESSDPHFSPQQTTSTSDAPGESSKPVSSRNSSDEASKSPHSTPISNGPVVGSEPFSSEITFDRASSTPLDDGPVFSSEPFSLETAFEGASSSPIDEGPVFSSEPFSSQAASEDASSSPELMSCEPFSKSAIKGASSRPHLFLINEPESHEPIIEHLFASSEPSLSSVEVSTFWSKANESIISSQPVLEGSQIDPLLSISLLENPGTSSKLISEFTFPVPISGTDNEVSILKSPVSSSGPYEEDVLPTCSCPEKSEFHKSNNSDRPVSYKEALLESESDSLITNPVVDQADTIRRGFKRQRTIKEIANQAIEELSDSPIPEEHRSALEDFVETIILNVASDRHEDLDEILQHPDIKNAIESVVKKLT